MTENDFSSGIEKAIEIVEEKKETARMATKKETPPLVLVLERIIQDLEKEREV